MWEQYYAEEAEAEKKKKKGFNPGASGQSKSSGKNADSDTADDLGDAGQQSGNPWGAAIGTALKTMSAADKAKQAEFRQKQVLQTNAFDAYTRAMNMMG